MAAFIKTGWPLHPAAGKVYTHSAVPSLARTDPCPGNLDQRASGSAQATVAKYEWPAAALCFFAGVGLGTAAQLANRGKGA